MARVINISHLEGYGPPRKVAVAPGVFVLPGKEMSLDSKKLGATSPLTSGVLVVEAGNDIPPDIQALMRIPGADKQMTRWLG